MEVIVVNNSDYIGGAEIVLDDLIVNDKGNHYTVILPEGTFADLLRLHHVNVETKSSIGRLYRQKGLIQGIIRFLFIWVISLVRIIRICKSRKAQILYANTLHSGIYCVLPSIILRIPLLWHVHDITNNSKWALLLRFCSQINKRLQFIVVSKAVAHTKLFKAIKDEQINLIYNGIDINNKFLVDSYIPKKLIKNKVIEVLMYGRIIKWKGFHLFLLALSKLDSEIKGTVICKIGGEINKRDPYFQYLQQIIDDNNLNNIVSFIGSIERSELPELLSEVDIVVHASIEPDPLPTVVLESMAMAKLVIAANAGGVSEMIDDKLNGLLIEPNNINSLTNVLTFAVEELRRGTQICQKARLKIVDQFSIEKKIANINKLYLKSTI